MTYTCDDVKISIDSKSVESLTVIFDSFVIAAIIVAIGIFSIADINKLGNIKYTSDTGFTVFMPIEC